MRLLTWGRGREGGKELSDSEDPNASDLEINAGIADGSWGLARQGGGDRVPNELNARRQSDVGWKYTAMPRLQGGVQEKSRPVVLSLKSSALK